MTATVTLSVEIELGWGMHDRQRYDHLSPGRRAETDWLQVFLDNCGKYSVPVSFDVVGHLFHESCSGEHNSPHVDGWFSEDPGTNVERDPLFYAPDLIRMVAKRSTNHEICTHTYSHLLASKANKAAIRWDLNTALEAQQANGYSKPVSVVMPRHHKVPHRLLKEVGLEVLRRPSPNYEPPEGGAISTYSWMLTKHHPESFVDEVGGVTRTHCAPYPTLTSLLLPQGIQSAHLAYRALPIWFRKRLHRTYLRGAVDSAIASDGHLHLWTHLHNMANRHQLSVIESLLEYLSEKRASEDIEIKKMCELPEATH